MLTATHIRLQLARTAMQAWCVRGQQSENLRDFGYLPATSSNLIAKPEVGT